MAFSYKPLFRLMLEKDMKKTDLQELGISRSTIAKFEKREYVALEVIDRLCTHFKVQPNQIIEHVNEVPNE